MINTGNTAYMLFCTCLVMLMTPGLAFFYAGLVGRKNVVTIMMQSFVSLGVTTVLWVAVGYSLCFSGDVGGVIGNLDLVFLRGISSGDLFSEASGVPVYVFIAYQMMFAVITPALLSGAFTNRVGFGAYVLFLLGWNLFIYFPMVHMVWGGGLIQSLGVLDFAGGIPVHAVAGMGALASVFYVGKRKVEDTAQSIPLMAIGVGILWCGWFGFNSGGAMAVDNITVQVFLNSQIAAGFAGVAWLCMDLIFEKKPKLVGFLIGALAGLVSITPGCGFVSTGSAAIIGTAGGLACYAAILFKNRMGWDDALDVWGVHAVGGTLGMVLLGVFADTAVNPAGADGLLNGNFTFFIKQTAAVLAAGGYSFIATYALFMAINAVIPVRVDRTYQEKGLDEPLHGETAYLMD